MASKGISLKELYEVDLRPEEQAERMSFGMRVGRRRRINVPSLLLISGANTRSKLTDVVQNEWVSEIVSVKVAARMFSSGSRYGCFRMRDMDHGRIKVLKVCFFEQSEEHMWQMVQTQALAEICCAIFRAKCSPHIAPVFPPQFVYRMLERAGEPSILVDELLAEGYNFEKRWLSLHPSSSVLEVSLPLPII